MRLDNHFFQSIGDIGGVAIVVVHIKHTSTYIRYTLDYLVLLALNSVAKFAMITEVDYPRTNLALALVSGWTS